MNVLRSLGNRHPHARIIAIEGLAVVIACFASVYGSDAATNFLNDRYPIGTSQLLGYTHIAHPVTAYTALIMAFIFVFTGCFSSIGYKLTFETPLREAGRTSWTTILGVLTAMTAMTLAGMWINGGAFDLGTAIEAFCVFGFMAVPATLRLANHELRGSRCDYELVEVTPDFKS